MTESESVALPLGDTPIKVANVLYQIEKIFSSNFKVVFNIIAILSNHILCHSKKKFHNKPSGSART